MRGKRRLAAIIALLLLALILLLPWHAIIGGRVISLLEAQGLTQVRLQVKSVNLSSLALSNLSFGEETPLTLEKLTLDYSLRDLWRGHINGITLSNLHLLLQKGKAGWGFSGLEHLGGSGEAALPVTADAIPLSAATLEDSQLQLHSDLLQGAIPLHLTWNRTPQPAIDYTGTGLTLTIAGIGMTTGATSLHIALNEEEKTWKGNWASKAVMLTGLPVDMPALACSGSVIAKEKSITLTGSCADANGKFKTVFTFDYPFSSPMRASLAVQTLTFPWNGGTIAVKNMLVPLSGMQSFTAPVTVANVSLNALLQALTGNRASGTGAVSGSLPLTVNPDFSVYTQSSLAANEPGIIRLAPDAIPGDNAQITLLRDLLADFHYSLLSLTFDSKQHQPLVVTLSLEGNNPAVYQGRSVKLNVHLGGDVLDFITQSMTVNDPRKLLKQSIHAP